MAEFRLETPRLILRGWRDRDREASWAMHGDAEVMRYLPKRNREEADAAIDRMITAQAEHGHCFWALERKHDAAVIGTCGIVVPRPPLSEYEIGWRLAHDAWGQGYAIEAAQATLTWAWTHRPMATIVAITVAANTASWRLMERLGMTRQPAEDFDHPEVPEGDPLRPHILYRSHRPA